MNLSTSGAHFSPHQDVLGATPSSPTEVANLLEELKRRGRVSVTTQRYPDAVQLYTKAIDVSNVNDSSSTDDGNSNSNNNNNGDVAIFYSNRSLCHLKMNQPSKARDDATSSTCHDPSYLKAYWRLGQACAAIGTVESYQDAIVAYQTGIDKTLEQEEEAGGDTYDKAKGEKKVLAWRKEVAKVEKLKVKKVEELKRKKEEEEELHRLANSKNETAPATATATNATKIGNSTTASTTKPTSTATSSSTSTSKSTTTTTSQDNEFSKSDHVRGYKVVNGKKTSFFHHEQTEEEKRLIGDIAPKRIDATATTSGSESNTNGMPTPISGAAAAGGGDKSVWNKAGTWEEKDVTQWATTTLREALLKCQYTLPPSSPDPNAQITLTKVLSLNKGGMGDGHASFATVRTKKKYIFEFSISIEWTFTSSKDVLRDDDTIPTKCHGAMDILDVDGTHELGEGYDINEYTVKSLGTYGADTKFVLERFVRDDGFRKVVEQALDDWITLFRETY